MESQKKSMERDKEEYFILGKGKITIIYNSHEHYVSNNIKVYK